MISFVKIKKWLLKPTWPYNEMKFLEWSSQSPDLIRLSCFDITLTGHSFLKMC